MKLLGKIVRKIYSKHDKAIIEQYAIREEGNRNYIGENVHMILRRDNNTAGIFSDYLVFCGGIEFAITRGYLPVIDRLNYPDVVLQNKQQQYKENAWEYFFEQPCNVGMENIKEKGKLLIYSPEYSEGNIFHGLRMQYYFKINKDLKNYWKSIAQKYIRFNENTQKALDEEYKKLFGNEKKNILGVAVREGYSVAIKNKVSSLLTNQPSLKKMMEDIKLILKQDGKIEKIFIACEYEETIEDFQKNFPSDMIIFVKKDRYRENEDYPCDPYRVEEQYDKKDRKKIALNYIKEIYLLSKCNSFVYSLASGSVAACLMKKGEYTHEICYDLGICE